MQLQAGVALFAPAEHLESSPRYPPAREEVLLVEIFDYAIKTSCVLLMSVVDDGERVSMHTSTSPASCVIRGRGEGPGGGWGMSV